MHNELIEALEKAGWKDQKFLMRDAFDALRPEPRKWNGFPWLNPRKEWVAWYQDWRWFEAAMRIGAYESAALALVPDGMRARFVIYEEGKAGAQLWWPTDPFPNALGRCYATPALAICIASLRARKDG